MGFQKINKIKKIKPFLVGLSATGLPISSTGYVLTITGDNFDTDTVFEILNNEDNNIIITSVFVKTPQQAELTLTIGSVQASYRLSCNNDGNTHFHNALSFQTRLIKKYTPKATGVAPELWVKSGNNNNSILTTGGYEAENSGGNGWNEHAYFGSFTSASRLDFSFKVDRLQGASNAYCHIRTNNQNNVSTAGNPRVYIQNGTTFLVYAPNGANIASTQIAVDDVIDIVLEPNKYEVFKNGDSIAIYNGAVNLNSVYMNFTGYRVAKLSNINAKVY